MKKMYIVGLTGGIGSGKTTVSNMFHELGAKVIDADKITHELEDMGQPAYNEILKQFGPDVIDDKGQIRRGYLRQLVFNDRNLKKILEQIVHPLVRSEINQRIKNNDHPYCILSIPLLFEKKSDYNIDRILVVDIPEELQIRRASSRDGVNRDDILKIIQMQADRGRRIENADDVIYNDEGLDSLRTNVRSLHDKYMHLAREKV